MPTQPRTDGREPSTLTYTADDPDNVLWWVALTTGMRRGELLGLRRRDLALERRVGGQLAPALNVRQQYARSGRAGLRFRSLKTGDNAWRTIDLDVETAAVLRHHVEAQDRRREAWGESYRADLDPVFGHPDGSPYDPDVATHRFERQTELCPGVIRIRFHDMRHTHATLLLEEGATERYVAERLGDTVEMIHETYGHVTPRCAQLWCNDSDRSWRVIQPAVAPERMLRTGIRRSRTPGRT
jgi:integrase